jgi:hypothetical protein
LMPLDHIRDLPRLLHMTPGADRSQLGFVDVDMACRAFVRHRSELQVFMTGCALHRLVLPFQ